MFTPQDFLKSTPEEEAIEQLQAIYEQEQSMKSHFPGKHVHARIIGHAPVIDYVTMALLGMDINLANWNKFGGIRDYLETDFLEFDEEGRLVHASFREHGIGDIAEPVTIESVVARLREQSEQRRAKWREIGVKN